MFTAQVIFDEILCCVDTCRQPYNALPTGNRDIVSSLAQWGLTKSHVWLSQTRGTFISQGVNVLLQYLEMLLTVDDCEHPE